MKNTVSVLLFSLILILPTFLYPQSEKSNKRGIELGDQNKLDEAIREFDKALEIREKASAKVYHNKAYALERKGLHAEAIKLYEEAWKRNPNQILTGERLGRLYYLTGDYENAVKIGEDVIRKDKDNREVPKWLPDAYKKRMEKRQEQILEEKRRQEEEARKYAEDQDKKKLDEAKKKEEKDILYATIDFMLRTGYYYGRTDKYMGLYTTQHKVYKVITDKGLIVDTPESIYIKTIPVKWLRIDILLEKPFLGALTPSLIEHSEMIEIDFLFKKFYFGIGTMFNHYNSNISWLKRKILLDYKPGLIIGYKKNGSEVKLTLYSRLFLPDGPWMSGKSFDVGMIKLDYSKLIKPDLQFNFFIHVRDMYVFCHNFDMYAFYDFIPELTPFYYAYKHKFHMSNYWGLYDIGFELKFINPVYAPYLHSFNIYLQVIERFYTRDLNNENPYSYIPNGQGYFGINTKGWTTGKPFSGFRAFSQVVGLKFEEYFTKNVFMYEKLIIEISDQNENHSEINLQLGAGVRL